MPLHEFMTVARSGLRAPAFVHFHHSRVLSRCTVTQKKIKRLLARFG